MRSHSGSDKARNNMHDPTIRDRQIKPKKTAMRAGRRRWDQMPARQARRAPAVTAEALSYAVVIRDPVERESEHKFACSRRPAEGGFRLAHAFAGQTTRHNMSARPGPAASIAE